MTVSSATRTFPLVSGLSRTATRKTATPTTGIGGGRALGQRRGENRHGAQLHDAGRGLMAAVAFRLTAATAVPRSREAVTTIIRQPLAERD